MVHLLALRRTKLKHATVDIEIHCAYLGMELWDVFTKFFEVKKAKLPIWCFRVCM